MMITRNNYESFLVDYADGTLPASEVREMEHFLAANPDIREEFEAYREGTVEEPHILFPTKSDLKKIPFSHMEAHSELFQQKCVAYVEQFMPDSEIFLFLDSVRTDAAKTKELEFFKKTILKPTTETFNEKLFLTRDLQEHEVTGSNFESYCVASLEGWLDQKGLIALNGYLMEHPEQKRVLDLFYKTRLVPEVSIFYPQKRQLKRFTLLTSKTKKVLTFTSSAAAVLVFGAMLFYTSQIDTSTTTVATSILSGNKQPTGTINVNALSTDKESAEVKNQLKNPLLADPFGYQKVNVVSTPKMLEKQMASEGLTRVKPIEVSELECHLCKELMAESRNLQLAISNTMEDDLHSANLEVVPSEDDSKKSLLWNLTQAGIKGITKLTNTELTVEKAANDDKTKIAFNSRYFAFTTQVESKKMTN